MKLTIRCGHCRKPFLKSLHSLIRQRRKGRRIFYCSLSCASTVNSGKASPRIKRETRVCPVCSTSFVIAANRLKKTCSRGCSNTFFRTGIRPTKASSHYRVICFKWHKKRCIVCGEDKIVAVHHYDHNRRNNNPENLVPLCPTHHQYVHSKFASLVKLKIETYVRRFKGGQCRRFKSCIPDQT